MKRHGGLWEEITSFENLYSAARQARKGKRGNPAVMAFEDHLEENLLRLRQELLDRSDLPGEYTCFEIFEPKRRLISTAPYRDRVVHHALVRVIGPLFEATFVRASYATARASVPTGRCGASRSSSAPAGTSCNATSGNSYPAWITWY